MPTRPTPPHCSHGCQQSYIEFLALPPLLFALQAERLFLVSANSDKTPHHTHLRHAKISQKVTEMIGRHSCSQPAVRPHLPPPTALFSAEAEKKPISLLYTSKNKGVVKCHNHFKMRINDPQLLHYRSGKSKSIFMNVQNPNDLKTFSRAQLSPLCHFSC